MTVISFNPARQSFAEAHVQIEVDARRIEEVSADYARNLAAYAFVAALRTSCGSASGCCIICICLMLTRTDWARFLRAVFFQSLSKVTIQGQRGSKIMPNSVDEGVVRSEMSKSLGALESDILDDVRREVILESAASGDLRHLLASFDVYKAKLEEFLERNKTRLREEICVS